VTSSCPPERRDRALTALEEWLPAA
jgi:hypothetical protein